MANQQPRRIRRRRIDCGGLRRKRRPCCRCRPPWRAWEQEAGQPCESWGGRGGDSTGGPPPSLEEVVPPGSVEQRRMGKGGRAGRDGSAGRSRPAGSDQRWLLAEAEEEHVVRGCLQARGGRKKPEAGGARTMRIEDKVARLERSNDEWVLHVSMCGGVI
jgi:hypothetical protein